MFKSWSTKKKWYSPAIALCSALILFLACIASAAYQRSQHQDTAEQRCSLIDLKKAEKPNKEDFKEDGALHVEIVPDQTVLMGQHICLLVAGASPGDALKRLNSDFELAELTATAERTAFDQAKTDLSGALQAASDAQKLAIAPGAKPEILEAAKKAAADLSAKKTAVAERAKTTKDADAAADTAAAALAKGSAPIQLTPFLAGHKAAFAAVNVPAVQGEQAVLIDFGTPSDANQPVASFWRDVLAGETNSGLRKATIGLARGSADIPEAVSLNSINLQLYDWITFGLGIATVCLLAIMFVLFARESTLLRDNSLMEQNGLKDAESALDTAQQTARENALRIDPSANEGAVKASIEADRNVIKVTEEIAEIKKTDTHPVGPYSLGRTQMALWIALTVSSYVFLWLTIGSYLNVINSSILVLLGLNSATGLLAVQINADQNASARSSNFVTDILTDGNGVALQRLQVVIWTVIIAIIFGWNVIYNFTFVSFDNNLLILIGIAQSAYIGFKIKEAPKP